jgi:hypothetical protein
VRTGGGGGGASTVTDSTASETLVVAAGGGGSGANGGGGGNGDAAGMAPYNDRFGGGGGSGDPPDDGSGGAPSVAAGGTAGSPGGAGVGGSGGIDGSSNTGGGGGGGGGVTGGGGGGGGDPGGGGGGGSSYSIDPNATFGVAATPMVTIAPPCAVGSYSSTGFAPCTAASAGHYVPSAQASAQDACALGYYQPQTGQSGCTGADIGYYVDSTGSASETACPAGTTTVGQDSTSASDCVGAPQITSADTTTFTSGLLGTFKVRTTGGPTPSLSDSSPVAGCTPSTLPSGLSFTDNDDGTATIAASATDIPGGEYTLCLTASNGIQPAATQVFTLDVDQAPSIPGGFSSSPYITFVTGQANTFTIPVAGFPVPSLVVTDCAPGDAFPPGVTVVQNADGSVKLSTTSAPVVVGDYVECFNLNNSVSNIGQQVYLTVDQAPAITSADAATFVAGTSATFKVTTTGTPTPAITDADFPTCSESSLPPGLSLHDNNDGTATIAALATGVTPGTYTFCLNASNGEGSAATQTFTLTVDQAPAITTADSATFSVGVAGSFTVRTTGTPTASLSDGGATLPSGVTFVDNGDGTATLAGKPGPSTGGSYGFTIIASNGVSPEAEQSFTLNVGQAPAITSASSTTFTSGTAGSFTVRTTGSPTATVGDASFAACAPSLLPAGISFTANADGTATLASTSAAIPGGVYTVCLEAANGVGVEATQTFTLTVDAAPAITSPATVTFTSGTAASFMVTTTGFPTPNVTDTSFAGCTASTLPAAVTFTPGGGGTAALASTSGAIPGGTYTLCLLASNGVGSRAMAKLVLTVDAAPSFTSATGVTFTSGIAGSFTVTTAGFPAATVAEAGFAGCASSTLPAGVSFTAHPGGTATLSTPAKALPPGTYTLCLVASNAVGAPATQRFTLTVLPPPTQLSAPPGNKANPWLVLTVRLTDVETGSPIAGATVTFTIGGERECVLATDSRGYVSCPIALDPQQVRADTSYIVTYRGSPTHQASTATGVLYYQVYYTKRHHHKQAKPAAKHHKTATQSKKKD